MVQVLHYIAAPALHSVDTTVGQLPAVQLDTQLQRLTKKEKARRRSNIAHSDYCGSLAAVARTAGNNG